MAPFFRLKNTSCRHVLFKQNTIKTMSWKNLPDPPSSQIERLTEAIGVSPTVARLLARLGFTKPERAKKFITADIAQLDDPSRVSHLEDAVARICQAIDQQEQILVFGDYDVDGVTAISILILALRHLGANPRYAVPRRMTEGYGLSQAAIDRMLVGGKPQLFIALDCGTNAAEPIAFLRAMGTDVIIIDHHRSNKTTPPQDCILVNPHVFDAPDEPWTHLCAAGLAFKLVHGLRRARRAQNDPKADTLRLIDFLDLVAMGTIADLVPLQYENRIYTRFGLEMLKQRKRPGVDALLTACGIAQDQPLMPSDVSFRIGPRINASGRLDDATIAVELFLSTHAHDCHKMAAQLNDFNRERQEKERLVTEQAQQMVEINGYEKDPVFLLYGEDWHPGVVGIVAGKLSRQYARPCIVLGQESKGIAKGSGRGIHALNLVEILSRCKDLLLSWGGHPMAVGVSLEVSNINTFREAIIRTVTECQGCPDGDCGCDVEIAAWLQPADIGEDLLHDLEGLMPFGEANPEPIFGVRNMVLTSPVEIFGDGNFRFYIKGTPPRRGISVVAWRKADRLPPVGTPFEMAVRISWNFYNGRQYPQAELIDWRHCTKA